MTKSMQMCSKFQKWNKKIHGTFKGSDRVPNFRSFFLRNLFKCRDKKRFCRENTEPFGFRNKYNGFIQNSADLEVLQNLKVRIFATKPFFFSTKYRKKDLKLGTRSDP